MPAVRIIMGLLLAATSLECAHAQDASFPARVLVMHNQERESLGIAPLQWNAALAEQARQWAASLARRGAFEHAGERAGQGENLWMGTAGFFSPEDMIGGFLSERRWFRPGVFPLVSRTGQWHDVGHYSQMIWPGTRELGCAVIQGKEDEVLVCRYWPAGNVMGQQVP